MRSGEPQGGHLIGVHCIDGECAVQIQEAAFAAGGSGIYSSIVSEESKMDRNVWTLYLKERGAEGFHVGPKRGLGMLLPAPPIPAAIVAAAGGSVPLRRVIVVRGAARWVRVRFPTVQKGSLPKPCSAQHTVANHEIKWGWFDPPFALTRCLGSPARVRPAHSATLPPLAPPAVATAPRTPRIPTFQVLSDSSAEPMYHMSTLSQSDCSDERIGT